MKYRAEVEAAYQSPEKLERLFQIALKENNEAAFQLDVVACHRSAPDNLLYAAWFHRLNAVPRKYVSGPLSINWKFAVPLSMVSGLILWLLSDKRLV